MADDRPLIKCGCRRRDGDDEEPADDLRPAEPFSEGRDGAAGGQDRDQVEDQSCVGDGEIADRPVALFRPMASDRTAASPPMLRNRRFIGATPFRSGGGSGGCCLWGEWAAPSLVSFAGRRRRRGRALAPGPSGWCVRVHMAARFGVWVQVAALKFTFPVAQPTPWIQTFWTPGMSGAMSF